MPENSKDGYTESGKVAAHAQTLAPPRGRTKAKREPDTGDRVRLLLGWGRDLGGQLLALIELLLGGAARNLKTPHTRTKASAWGEGRSKLGLGTLRAETAPRKQRDARFWAPSFLVILRQALSALEGSSGLPGRRVEPWQGCESFTHDFSAKFTP